MKPFSVLFNIGFVITACLVLYSEGILGDPDPDFDCPGKEGLFPTQDGDCSSYYNCWDGIAYRQSCSEGLYFNPLTRVCDFRDNVICNQGSGIPTKKPEEESCGSNQPLLISSSSNIRSPKINGLYKKQSKCSWLIVAPLEQAVLLKFTSFDLENSKRCQKDFVRVYEDGQLVGSYCGTGGLIPPKLSGGTLLIHFESDDELEFSGFEATVEFQPKPEPLPSIPPLLADEVLACGENTRPFLTSYPLGKVQSPGYKDGLPYPPNSVCMWMIKAPDNMYVTVNITYLWIEGSLNCGLDFLAFFDGNSFATDPRIATYCGILTGEGTVGSSGSEMLILFVSDFFRQFRGFELEYAFTPTPPTCNADELKCSSTKKCVKNQLRCDGYDDCDGSPDDELNCDTTTHNDKVECGIPEIPPVPGNNMARIVGGREAVEGSWPWQAVLFAENIFQCGGVLISESWILTAAHCFKSYRPDGPEVWTVSVGKHKLLDREEEEQKRRINRIILHPYYQPQNPGTPPYLFRENDIALMELDRPVTFTDRIIPICLPNTVTYSQELQPGKLCHVTGFGETLGTPPAELLKQAQVPLIHDDECEVMYPGKIAESMFCAGWEEGGHDACQGDSGGPLVCPLPQTNSSDGTGDRWELTGIVSWGNKCALAGKPGVNTEVHYFIDWIEKVTNVHFTRSQ